MSYSYDIKEEISQVNNYKNKEVLKYELLGFILTSNTIYGEDFIEYSTENDYTIERFYKILFNLGIDYEPNNQGKMYVARINRTKVLNEIMNLNQELTDEYKRAIVKGVFLSNGSCTDPNKQYHLELQFETKENAEYVYNICQSYSIKLKKMINKNRYQLYIKDSEEISKFLALIGANKAVLKFEDVRLTKEVKNNVNRFVNCETANLNKIVNASVNQVNDILLIQKMKKFDELPDYLKEIAILRLENPDDSLKVLGSKLEKPIGKSGVNHRLEKIHEIAEELRR